MSRRVYDSGRLVEEWDDATRTYRRWVGDALVEERPYTTAEAAPLVAAERDSRQAITRADLLSRIDAALSADLAYLASTAPATAAERLLRLEGQVDRLTRQVVLLLRLVGGRLDDTAGS